MSDLLCILYKTKAAKVSNVLYLRMSPLLCHGCLSYFYARCQCWIICCCVKSATLTFTSPPPLSARSPQVCTIICADAEAWMCEWGCLLFHHHPLFVRVGVQRSVFMCRGAISAAAAVTVGAFSSAPSLHQPQQHHSTFESIYFSQAAQHRFLLSSSLRVSLRMRQQQRRHILGWSTFLFLLSCFSHLLHHCSLRCSSKSSQAVSSPSKSVCWLGSWSSAVPLEDDPVDEDRRDGPGRAAGETEDSHPNHRWVTATRTIPSSCCCVVISKDLAGRLIFACILYFSNN